MFHLCTLPSFIPNFPPAWKKDIHTPSSMTLAKLCFSRVCSDELKENTDMLWKQATTFGKITVKDYEDLLIEYGKEKESVMKKELPLCTLRLFAVIHVQSKHACYLFTSKQIHPDQKIPDDSMIIELYRTSASTYERATELMQERFQKFIKYSCSIISFD